jgi:thiamine biosynthesis lipoprotein
MALTLNGIAQGYITDRVTELLKAEGLTNAVVKMGEISLMGTDENGEPWQVGLAKSENGPSGDHVYLSNEAIATSSPAGTTFDGDAGHIIDPVIGRPATSRWQQVSVIHKSAAIADALSTAAVMMKENEIEGLISRFPKTRLIARNVNGQAYSYAG